MRKLMVINHFPTVIPPTSGATIRYFYLYKELSRYYDITLLSQTFGHKSGLFRYSPSFREYKIEKDRLYNRFMESPTYENALIAHIKASKHPTVFKTQFDQLYEDSDVIIHESPFLFGCDEYAGRDIKFRVYNSHNHEFLLAENLWKSDHSITFLPELQELEKKLVTCSDIVFATSELERDSFISMYKKNPAQVKCAPNGVHPFEWLPTTKKSNKRPKALFIGSDYMPNIEAAQFICHELADDCPAIDFIIAGGCSTALTGIRKPNVRLLGRIGHKQKLKLFAECDFALNPVTTGAGVPLKTLEFLAAGLSLFSTSCGVRGLKLTDGNHYIRAEKDNFAEQLNRYCENQSVLKRMASNGCALVHEHYSWSRIAKKMADDMETVIR
ncbi:MAG: glycosyltransferase family 4 protein [Tuberibacillus sp.]